ncbi:UPF0369 protein C6orf57 [Striga asiatica]|uniref:Succinate dehydrogenase assembly factor 4, mitochondrial n=1 Tax=Striga asiatica TaxID=4170 RepID=A0A5A7QQ03_STRAF|nr:UPF0369 protein C6orf57 [Striga asiatica]
MATNLYRQLSSSITRVSNRWVICTTTQLFQNQWLETKESQISDAKEKIHDQTEDERKPTSKDEEDGGDLVNKHTGEVDGPRRLEPTRYGDWENHEKYIQYS